MKSKTYKKTLEALIKSAIYGNAKIFFPFLKKEDVSVTMYNKVQFYDFYKQMISCNNLNIRKDNYYKWGRLKIGYKNYLTLKIFNNAYKYPLLTFIIEKTNSQLILKLLPF